MEVERPFAVQEYNKYMGGVDLPDMLIELYRIKFNYLLDLCVVNAWLLYRRVHERKESRKNFMPFVDFNIEMAEGLLNSKVSGTPRGRPSTTRVEARAGARVGARAGAKEEKRKPRPNHEYAPEESVRYDAVSYTHL